jgi:hypothetical protein
MDEARRSTALFEAVDALLVSGSSVYRLHPDVGLCRLVSLATYSFGRPPESRGSTSVRGRSDKQVGKSQNNKPSEAEVDKAENPPILRCVAFRELPGHEVGERV